MKKTKKIYNYQSLKDEREYGFYWYSALWRVLRPILILLSALLIVTGLLVNGWNKVYDAYIAPIDLKDKQEIIFSVEEGSSLTKISNKLNENDLIRNKTIFKYFMDFKGLGQKIQVGEYKLNKSMTITEIADILASGDGRPITKWITIIPGWNIEDIAKYLAEEKILTSSDEFISLAKEGTQFNEYYYIADLLSTQNFSQRKYALEGYLSPNTYEIYTDVSAKEIINKVLSQTEAAYPAEFHQKAEDMGYTMDQIITLASIIEKEARNADFAKVSAVFHNRLKKGMKLQSDVTIHYVTGVRRMALKEDDISSSSPYNTYQIPGLPVGPICSPSPAAISAAINPDETFVAEEYLYFCSKDPNTAELHFSKTLEEHEQAVAIYAPLWRAYDESRGL